MSPNQIPPARNVKIRRVRGLAAFGGVAVVLVYVLLLAVAQPVARRWVLVLDFNFTEGSWRWRNVTVVRGWELKWNNETTYVF